MKKFLALGILILSFALHINAANRALLVGIGEYDTRQTGWHKVHGDKDVEMLSASLKRHGFTDIKVLKNSEATKAAIVSQLKKLASRCKQGDKVYFHFSGHGQPIRDDNHDEENGDNFDESIIPYDACRDKLKMNGTYIGQNHLVDDELNPLLDAIIRKLGPNGELFVAIDACYSKGIEKDEITDLDPELLKFVRGTNIAFIPPGCESFVAGLPKPKKFSIGAKLTVVTACGSDERNYEYKTHSGKMYGSLSYYMNLLLKSTADFSTWRANFMNKDYTRRNIFNSSQHPSIKIYN